MAASHLCGRVIPNSVDGNFGPLIPNKVADKFVPASYQEIGGYLGYRLDVNLRKRLLQIDSATLLSGFERRPGSQTWIGEHVGKFLFSASKTYAYTHNPQLRQLMDAMVRTYIACQLPDGYLGTYLVKDRWTAWDVWAHKYAIIGLLNYYSVTGDTAALATARRAADLVCRTFGDEPGKRDLMPAGEHDGLAPGSILEPMVDLYRYTGDAKYLGFCRYVLRAYEQADGPKIISRLEQYADVTRVGDAKAYEMLSCFLGILKYYQLTGDERYLHVLEKAWADISSHRLYITGTASDHELFVGSGILKATNADKMGEGCVTVTWIQFNLALLRITGDLKYAEELERSVYNHLLAAENPQTGCVSYYTALLGVRPYRCDQGFSCCLSSVPRGISLIPEIMGGQIGGDFSVLFYENGVARATIRDSQGQEISLEVRSSTRFPADGIVHFEIEPGRDAEFTIRFRVPTWTRDFQAGVGGARYAGAKNGMLSIRRHWKKGDRVEVKMDIPVEVLPGGPTYPHSVAIKRGPQVLAFDRGLNADVDSAGAVQIADETRAAHAAVTSLADASAALPADWGWKEAFFLDAKIGDRPRRVVLVPFAEAGQMTGDVAVWIGW
jgi:DUF1680 family protein